MKEAPSIKISFWKRWLVKAGIYILQPADKATTIVVEVNNATGGISINKIQDIPFTLAVDIFKRIINLSK